jgi:hypothetical protein
VLERSGGVIGSGDFTNFAAAADTADEADAAGADEADVPPSS